MIFFKNTVCETDSSVINFQAIESDKIIGSCTLALGEKFADVTELDYEEKSPYAVEGLLKSAYNYAALKNYYMAKCSVKDIDAFLERMNFKKIDEEYTSDIPTILMGSCNSCGGK